MESTPEEILIDILDYLGPPELVAVQQTCSVLSKTGRANSIWRAKCFEKSPSASMRSDAGTLTTLTTALEGLTISDRPRWSQGPVGTQHHEAWPRRESPRARALARWDLSAENELVDWYSEYKARHAPLSVDWLAEGPSHPADIKGIAPWDVSDRAVGFLDDASICVWDLAHGPSGRRQLRVLGQSAPSALVSDAVPPDEALVVNGVSTVATQQKAFIAVGNVLNEVDLQTLQVVSHSKYAFPITALSQQTHATDPLLTVGTSWSLHILDPRVQVAPSSSPSDHHLDQVPAVPGSSTAILPDMAEDSALLPKVFGVSTPFAYSHPSSSEWTTGSPSTRPSHRLLNPHWLAYARVEPGPLSILHHGDNEILIGGRFPSILSYDRRFFPQPQYVIHSSASLAALACIPHPPAGASSTVTGQSTLVACGEYRGRGSLELYSLPHVKQSDQGNGGNVEDADLSLARGPSADEGLFSYKNRQEASKSKLLSVASHGTKIVFSDADGGLKWVERDGRSLVRRWNINGYHVAHGGASVVGDQVVRKMIPLAKEDSERGHRGDDDLLIWTGDRIGVVTTNPQFVDHAQLVRNYEADESETARAERQQVEQYSREMRRALERQADERRWMSQFRLKRREF